mmetsp:Transcript_38519/g.79002  ORF Transcript_38519/g.79002 Transcript_38519/m.79002 type:complete len:409 (+) Transcript_38519:120-1346(+)
MSPAPILSLVALLIECVVARSLVLKEPAFYSAAGDATEFPQRNKETVALRPSRQNSENFRQDTPFRTGQFYDKADEAVFLLDLDKTALFGNDGNDLGMALQWMEQPHEVVAELYKKLVSPCIRPAYKALKLKAKKVHVVLYTRRPQLVQYRSGFRDCALQVQYKDEWHCNGQICFPSHIRESSEITDCYKGPETIPEEATDMQKAIERLLAARDAITEELELDAPPDVVVTATEKDVSSTVCALGLPDRNAYLFDDNTNLQYDSKVVITEPLESLPLEQTREVLKFMNHHLPVHTLDEDLVEFLQGSPLDNRALEFDPETQQLCWRCPVMTQQPPVWRIPEFVATEAMGRPRSGGLSRSRSLSPVTPDSVTPPLESLASSARSCASQQGAVNLRAAVERAIELRKAAA